MDFFSRLEYFIEDQNETINSFTLKMGFSSGLIAKAVKKNGSLGSDKVMKIFQQYPDLSPNWLFTGRGEMLLSNDTKNAKPQVIAEPTTNYQPSTTCSICKSKDCTIDRLDKQLDHYEKEIEWLRNQIQINCNPEKSTKRNSA